MSGTYPIAFAGRAMQVPVQCEHPFPTTRRASVLPGRYLGGEGPQPEISRLPQKSYLLREFWEEGEGGKEGGGG